MFRGADPVFARRFNEQVANHAIHSNQCKTLGPLTHSKAGCIQFEARPTGVTLIRLRQQEKLVGLARIEPEDESADESSE